MFYIYFLVYVTPLLRIGNILPTFLTHYLYINVFKVFYNWNYSYKLNAHYWYMMGIIIGSNFIYYSQMKSLTAADCKRVGFILYELHSYSDISLIYIHKMHRYRNIQFLFCDFFSTNMIRAILNNSS